jgi:hypothetical protein
MVLKYTKWLKIYKMVLKYTKMFQNIAIVIWQSDTWSTDIWSSDLGQTTFGKEMAIWYNMWAFDLVLQALTCGGLLWLPHAKDPPPHCSCLRRRLRRPRWPRQSGTGLIYHFSHNSQKNPSEGMRLSGFLRH